ncbi:putative Transcription initiation factor TFIID subunit 7-like protein [Naja naja]|nr:putative Transcription initiation factor TFIID subunit 7-like protein [Naja naja]
MASGEHAQKIPPPSFPLSLPPSPFWPRPRPFRFRILDIFLNDTSFYKPLRGARRGGMASAKVKMTKNKDNIPHELESQFILRLPSLVDLPCTMESLKTIDKKTFYKTADICQMLVCTVDGELYPPLEEPAVSTDARANKKKDKDREKKFIWNHGITLPLKNVRRGGSERQLRRSSSSDEDDRDHHDDEDLNVMDTEEDLERRLQGKLNESSSQQQENEGTSQIAIGIQKQIDNLKGKLQETQERRKRQEDLIMKVENLALKTRLQAVLDEFKQQEEREKQQLASLQEQLEALIEK